MSVTYSLLHCEVCLLWLTVVGNTFWLTMVWLKPCFSFWCWCNILIYTSYFQYTWRAYTNGIYPFVYAPGIEQYIIFHVLHNSGEGQTEVRQVFAFSCNGWWNIVQVRMISAFRLPSDSERIEQSGNSIEGHGNIYQACWLWRSRDIYQACWLFFLAKFLKFSVSCIPEVSLEIQTRLVSQNKSKNC